MDEVRERALEVLEGIDLEDPSDPVLRDGFAYEMLIAHEQQHNETMLQLLQMIDGYEPPEDPLRGVWRQMQATALLKRDFPRMVFVGSAYSYLQEWLPHVGQRAVREGLCDFVGLGRIAKQC